MREEEGILDIRRKECEWREDEERETKGRGRRRTEGLKDARRGRERKGK